MHTSISSGKFPGQALNVVALPPPCGKQTKRTRGDIAGLGITSQAFGKELRVISQFLLVRLCSWDTEFTTDTHGCHRKLLGYQLHDGEVSAAIAFTRDRRRTPSPTQSRLEIRAKRTRVLASRYWRLLGDS
jgi:hypothetical protein